MSYTTIAYVDLNALQHNLQKIRDYAPHSKVLAMVKANAYGHGLIPIARALANADALGIARIHEAIQLREAGIQNTLVLMEGFFEAWEIPLVIEHDLQVVVHNFEQIALLQQAITYKPISVWLKIDTGMHRLGFVAEEVLEAWQQLNACQAIAKNIRLMTHFSDAEMLHLPLTSNQIKLFNQLTQHLPGEKSLANSAAIMAWPQSHLDWIRPGIMLYGINPFPERVGIDNGLQPVMTLISRILTIHQRKKGETIGYNGTYICPDDMRTGIIAIGYGDGYPRYISSDTPVIINDRRTQILGRVSMDMTTINLQLFPHSQVGDEVILWGKSLPIEIIAHCANTSPYELLCGMTQRVEFLYHTK